MSASLPRRVGRLVAVAMLFGAPLAISTPADAAKKGQLCTKSKEGAKEKDADGNTLTCVADGSRYRWDGPSGTPNTRAASKSDSKSSSKSSSKSTKTKRASSGSGGGLSSGGGEAVKGRFCAKADAGRRANNDKGERLVCREDNNGRYRWQD